MTTLFVVSYPFDLTTVSLSWPPIGNEVCFLCWALRNSLLGFSNASAGICLKLLCNSDTQLLASAVVSLISKGRLVSGRSWYLIFDQPPLCLGRDAYLVVRSQFEFTSLGTFLIPTWLVLDFVFTLLLASKDQSKGEFVLFLNNQRLDHKSIIRSNYQIF